LTLKHNALGDHITFNAAASALPLWQRMDIVVLSWLFSTITIDLQDIIRE
jgi:hypothetical protein